MEMPSVDTAMGTLTLPIWAAGAACAIFLVALVLAARRAGGAMLINSLFRASIVALVAYGGWVYLQRTASQDRATERRALEERSAALMARAIAPGSALSCLDELAGETVEAACQKGVFASPEAVAAAVSYVTAKLALVNDASVRIRELDAALAADLVPMRAALELDRFGIVAHVLSQREGCTADKCEALARFKDSSRVVANLRGNAFDDMIAKYTPVWSAPRADPATVAAAPTQPLPNNLSPAPATVSPKYDFPSAQSIPPVNIMANEPPPSRGNTAADPGAPGGTITPVPPRRPPQGRTPPAASGRPLRPDTVVARPDNGEPPTDGSVGRGTAQAPR
jgi:hypothetical protein